MSTARISNVLYDKDTAKLSHTTVDQTRSEQGVNKEGDRFATSKGTRLEELGEHGICVPGSMGLRRRGRNTTVLDEQLHG